MKPLSYDFGVSRILFSDFVNQICEDTEQIQTLYKEGIPMKDSLSHEIQAHTDELIWLRRRFHTCPETAWEEFSTTQMIREYLSPLGYVLAQLPVKEHHTGLLATLSCGRGPVVTFRFDIDGLPVQESDSCSHFPAQEGFLSKNPGRMHACGHDGHIAIGLMTAKLLHQHRDQLHGTLQLLFQPAEEGCRGAQPIAESGLLNTTDIFLSGHIVPAAQYPQITGDFMVTDGSYATTKLDVTYYGKAAHAAHPGDGRSVMPGTGCLLTRLYALTNPENEDTILNVGTLSAGTGRNILADQAHMEIEVRGKTTEKNTKLTEAVLTILQDTAETYGLQKDVKIVGSAPSLKSTQNLTEELYRLFSHSTLPLVSSPLKTTAFMASEDAAHLMEAVKSHGGQAAYLLFPARTSAVLHQPDYTFDETVLSKAVEVYCRTALHFLEKR